MPDITSLRLLIQPKSLEQASPNLNDLEVINLHANNASSWDQAIDEANFIKTTTNINLGYNTEFGRVISIRPAKTIEIPSM